MKQSDLKCRKLFSVLLIAAAGLLSCIEPSAQSSENKAESLKTENIQIPVTKAVDDTTYPQVIIEKGLQKEYDEAKWDLYVFSVIDTPKIDSGKYAFSNPKSYSAYPLVFDRMSNYYGTDIMLLSFYIDGVALTDKRAIELGVWYVPDAIFKETYDGQKYRCKHSRGITENEAICFGEGLEKKLPKNLTKEQFLKLHEASYRLSFPLNPVVVEYINKHQSELNPWFVAEARKRGVIK